VITSKHKPIECPLCRTILSRASNFTLFGRAYSNVYVCQNCNELILSWRLFIKHRNHPDQAPLIILTNDRLHAEFIEEARLHTENESFAFDEEVVFVLTDKHFKSLRKESCDNREDGYGLVIEAYHASLARRTLNLQHNNKPPRDQPYLALVPFFVSNTFARYCPVYDLFTRATSSGVPFATISPPLSPPSGPISIT
jgi:hypothetical protein